MFKKLHNINQDSTIALQKKKEEITYRKNHTKNISSLQKLSSYSQKFRKKNNLVPQLPDLQIIQTEVFLFQGRLASVVDGTNSLISSQRQKHGQGVMFLKNGTLIVGFWDHGYLNGRALIFSPFGGKTIAQFYNGKMNGWAITILAQKLVVIAAYYENKIDGQKIIFQATQQMWVGSKYVKQTDVFKIIHIQKGTMHELPTFLKFSKTDQLVELYDQFINNQNSCLILKDIKFISITTNLTYIGYCNQDCHPNGLGAIYGRNQFYLGHFRQGSLQCYGRMIFQNGEIYHGELLNGVFYGQGVYYNPAKNSSTIMSTNRQEQKVIDEQEGYICINCSLNYFKFSKSGQTGMIDDPLNSISEIIQKYYSRYFIQRIFYKNQDSSARSEFGISENHDDIQSSMPKVQSPNRKKVKASSPQKNKQSSNIYDQNQRKWLNFNLNQSPLGEQSSFASSQQNQQELNLQRVYSLDKRQAHQNRQYLAEQSFPANLEHFSKGSNANDSVLQKEINRLRLDRNFSLKQKKPQNLNYANTLKVKQNIHPQQIQKVKTPRSSEQSEPAFMKKMTLNFNDENKKLSQDILTFRNQSGGGRNQLKQNEEIRNQRKYSHMVEAETIFSPSESVISNLSQKVDGLVKKNSAKRKKIFM